MLSDKRRYQLVYFVFFASFNGFMAFRNVYFEELGLTGTQMGVIGAVLVVAGMVAQPLWGMFADRFDASRRILLIGAGVSGVIMLAFPLAGRVPDPFILLIIATVLLATFQSPIVPIANSMVLSKGFDYGQVRAFGSIAFGIGSLVLGWALSQMATELVFYVYAVGMVVLVIILRGVPDGDADLSPDLRRDAIRLLTNRRFLLLLVFSMILGGVSASGSAYFSVYVRAIGASDALTGTAWMIKTVGEAIIFLAAARIGLANRYRLTIGAVIFAISHFIFAAVATPVAILGVQIFLGAGLALFYLAVVNFAHEFSPDRLTSTAQTVLFAFGIGTGRAIGQLAAGGVMESVGVQSMYYYLSAAAVLAVVVSVLFYVPSVRRVDTATAS